MQQTELDRYLIQFQYPGMPRPESNLTRAWLRREGLAYDRFDFNVRLGAGRAPIAGLTPEMQRQVQMTSQLRADVVGYLGDRVDIIEVKDRARSSAMGQLLGYQVLWTQDNPGIPVRRLVVVAQSIDPDAETILRQVGVEFAIVEPEEYRL
jgi:hypothetical protein